MAAPQFHLSPPPPYSRPTAPLPPPVSPRRSALPRQRRSSALLSPPPLPLRFRLLSATLPVPPPYIRLLFPSASGPGSRPFRRGSVSGRKRRGSVRGGADGGGADGGGEGPGASPGTGTGPGAAGRGALSLPGILHFIQSEWARFEAEKGRWEAERAELQAQVAFLQGERKGQENLKTDLVRRIKMLEYALKQERSKYHKLKFGTEPPPADRKAEVAEMVPNGPSEAVTMDGGTVAWKDGRQLLRQYLEEVGCSDTVLDMRSRRVRALLSRGPPAPPPAPQNPPGPGESLLVRRIEEQIQRNAGKEAKEPTPFLRPCEDEDSDEDEDENPPGERDPPRQHKKQRGKLPPTPLLPEADDDDDDDDDDDSEDALNEFDFLGSAENGDGRQGGELESRRVRLQGMLADLRDVDGIPGGAGPPHTREGALGIASDVFIMDSIGGAVSLGDLADLTVSNDNELSCDLSEGRDALKKTWNPKFTLRSHYDAVRALAFHPAEAALLTASEDGTLKLWNLQKTVTAKKNAALDVEPVYAFRGHRGPVLAVTVGRDAALCCSGGADGCVRRWRLPDLDMDPYDGYDPGVLSGVLEGHGDAVWGLAFNPAGDRLLSCSADGTVRLWDPRRDADACLLTYNAPGDHGVPTSVTFSCTDPTHAVLAFRSGAALLYDVEVTRPLLTLESRSGGDSQINHVVSHPSQPLSITANDDRSIRFLDHRTGHVVHSMVAHLDAVTCLAVDPNGVFLMSGSHDCSLRVWHLSRRTCVQELTAHRRKHDEAVHAVAFHPTRALSASAGADALAKVFV